MACKSKLQKEYPNSANFNWCLINGLADWFSPWQKIASSPFPKQI